ncbi:hypothetical protein K439DRAFT_1635258 [Ramaria rubella]|nr:hypothetical protein K439DRAFT_1635258 [Ramaria rubella]
MVLDNPSLSGQDMNELRTSIREILSTLSGAYNNLEFINRLSDDLMYLIFREASRNNPIQAVNISQVCRRWRYIALDQASLWTRVDGQSLAITELCLRLSKEAPLDFVINPLDEGVGRLPYSELFPRFIHPYIHRIKSLDIKLDTEKLKYVLPHLAQCSLPLLESLSIKPSNDYILPAAARSVQGEIGALPVHIDKLPRLRRLEFTQFAPSPESPIWVGMESLTLRNLQPKRTWAEYLQVLARSPDMMYLEIEELHNHAGHIPKPLHMTHLTCVNLVCSAGGASQLLSSVHMPNLVELRIRIEDYSHWHFLAGNHATPPLFGYLHFPDNPLPLLERIRFLELCDTTTSVDKGSWFSLRGQCDAGDNANCNLEVAHCGSPGALYHHVLELFSGLQSLKICFNDEESWSWDIGVSSTLRTLILHGYNSHLILEDIVEGYCLPNLDRIELVNSQTCPPFYHISALLRRSDTPSVYISGCPNIVQEAAQILCQNAGITLEWAPMEPRVPEDVFNRLGRTRKCLWF